MGLLSSGTGQAIVATNKPNHTTSSSKTSSSKTSSSKRSAVRVEDPPPTPWKRRSFWVVALEQIRLKPGVWHRADRLYTRATAAQIASDLRSVHRRGAKNVRVKGVLDGEAWDARWELSPDGPANQYAIWVMFLGRPE
jgi:hypothetical protein